MSDKKESIIDEISRIRYYEIVDAGTKEIIRNMKDEKIKAQMINIIKKHAELYDECCILADITFDIETKYATVSEIIDMIAEKIKENEK